MSKLIHYIRSNKWLFLLLALTLFMFLVTLRINYFRYNNFDFGKFDLGNMTQMVWNTVNGRFMYLTDYFGTNLPRWAMSHVDPILLLFVPGFLLWQHPLSLVFSQLFLVLFSSILVFKLTELEVGSKFIAFLVGASYLLYPALGYINAITGFHGVSAAIPFMFAAFYIFELMYIQDDYSKKRLTLFWVMLVILMAGKEQLPSYVVLFGLFILFFRANYKDKIGEFKLNKDFFKDYFNLKPVKIALTMIVVGLVWFYAAFFVIIPRFADHRVAGYMDFADSLGINTGDARDVALPNYFLSRYEGFGESYTDVFINIFVDPGYTARVFFGGDKIDNLTKTFAPVMFLPLAMPHVLIMSVPDFMANYLTTAGGIGTAEIGNHRISMIIPVLFISVILFLRSVWSFLNRLSIVSEKNKRFLSYIIPVLLVVVSVYTSHVYNNPVYLWVNQAVQKRLPSFVSFAKTDMEKARQDLEVGEVVEKLSALESKDVECAQKIVDIIPDEVSVSGPDFLGAQLSMRETYAIFPALYNSADYVIVDVFSQKITNILDLNKDIIRDVVEELIKDHNYELNSGCGNLFVFKKVTGQTKNELLPLQKRYQYEEKLSLEFFLSLYLVEYEFPEKAELGEKVNAKIVYTKREEKTLDNYLMFLSFIDTKTGDLYQMANLPSFAITRPSEWKEDYYYIENLDFVFPYFLEEGTYRIFIGMGNKIRTRSMYLGEIELVRPEIPARIGE